MFDGLYIDAASIFAMDRRNLIPQRISSIDEHKGIIFERSSEGACHRGNGAAIVDIHSVSGAVRIRR